MDTAQSCDFTGLEMRMGMGFPVEMGIPWDSHGNGNGNGNDFRGSGNVEKCFVKKIPIDIKFKAK